MLKHKAFNDLPSTKRGHAPGATEKTVEQAASASSKAIVIIGRTAGEEQDARIEKGSYLLTDEELDMLLESRTVKEGFLKLVDDDFFLFGQSCNPIHVGVGIEVIFCPRRVAETQGDVVGELVVAQ